MLMYVRLLRSRYIHCRHRHSSRVACCSLLLLYRYLFSLLRFCFFALFHINSFDFIAYPIRIAASSQCFTVTSENNDIKFVHVEMNTFHCFPVALIRFFFVRVCSFYFYSFSFSPSLQNQMHVHLFSLIFHLIPLHRRRHHRCLLHIVLLFQLSI